LLKTTGQGGIVRTDDILERSFFGTRMIRDPRRLKGDGGYTPAVRIQGTLPPATSPDGGTASAAAGAPLHVVMVADMDFISDLFFNIRREAPEGLNFDNITFVLNCVDVLAGDSAYVNIRKRRPRHRTLELVEKLTKGHRDKSLEEVRLAEDAAKEKLAEAQGRLDARVKELEGRSDLDAQTKTIMAENLREVESRRLEVTRRTIEDEKKAAIGRSQADMVRAIGVVQRKIKILAGVLPSIPALVIALVVWLVRLGQEKRVVA
jgi:ABC-2 type transport system permease protein